MRGSGILIPPELKLDWFGCCAAALYVSCDLYGLISFSPDFNGMFAEGEFDCDGGSLTCVMSVDVYFAG